MYRQPSNVYSHLGPRHFGANGPLELTDADIRKFKQLKKLGFALDENDLRKMRKYTGMDANDAGMNPIALSGQTAPSIGNLHQFLQSWLPGIVYNATSPRLIDELVGRTTVGEWEDEEIVQPMLEHLGKASPYGDYTNVPLSTWNPSFEGRTVVRFEKGFRVGQLEEKRTAKIRVSSSGEKRNAASLSLDIERNAVGFFGYNNGLNRTYGFLNDPNLLPYVTVPNGAGGSPLWQNKTYLEINADLRMAMARLRSQSGSLINPRRTRITIAIASDVVDFLTVTPEFGNSVEAWLNESYPNVRVIDVPELNGANGGANVMYVYAEEVDDASTDNKRTFDQLVPTVFMTLGVEKGAKHYLEDFSNATAGVLCKRPFAVVRLTGM